MQVVVEILAVVILAAAAAALSWFGVGMTTTEDDRPAVQLIHHAPIATDAVVVTPAAARSRPVPC